MNSKRYLKGSGKRESAKPARGETSNKTNENLMPMRTLPSDKASDCTCIHRPPVSTAGDIRSRFLNRLGIQKEGAPSSASSSRENSKDTGVDTSCCSDDASMTSTTPTCTTSSSFTSFSSSKPRSVSFDDSVTVRPIPRHDAYSDEQRHQIWADPLEIYENATRNSIEFAADNFDWQRAAEEEDFIPTVSGELVHPIHYARQCNMQHNFLLVMAARQQAQQCT